MRNDDEAKRVIELYSDMVQRLCAVHLKNHSDSEDIFQTVFFKYLLYPEEFKNEEHEKAWFIRVTINACKDFLKSAYKKKVSPRDILDELLPVAEPEKKEVLEVVLSLHGKYKDVIYLHYYEGYTASEIGKMLGKKENTVYTLLARGRKLLEKELGGEYLG